jgi:hypothetical protein
MLLGDTGWTRYAARAIRWGGSWQLLSWRHLDARGAFVGELDDPVAVDLGVAVSGLGAVRA